MRKIKEVLRLHHEAGLTKRQIGRSLGISHNSAGKYLEAAEAAGLGWPLPEEMDEDALRHLLFPGAGPRRMPSKPLPDMNRLHRELRRKHVTLRLLWEEYRERHGERAYGFTQFCDYYNRWREKLDVTMRSRHVAGEATFVDWAGQTVPWFEPTTGEERKAYVFVAVLGASDYTFCRAYQSTGLASWVEAHMAAFEFFGGLTRTLVPDNAKTAVTAACYYEPELHPTYAELAEHYGT
ncbi:MAG: IS21 family transposase, partial [Chloroflexota bacterium]